MAVDAGEQLAAPVDADQATLREPWQHELGHGDNRTGRPGRPTLSPMVHPRYAELGAFGRRVLGAVQRRTGTTPPARDRTGFYAPVDPGPGPAR